MARWREFVTAHRTAAARAEEGVEARTAAADVMPPLAVAVRTHHGVLARVEVVVLARRDDIVLEIILLRGHIKNGMFLWNTRSPLPSLPSPQNPIHSFLSSSTPPPLCEEKERHCLLPQSILPEQ